MKKRSHSLKDDGVGRGFRLSVFLGALGMSLVTFTPALANPESGQVSAGEATISQPNATTVQVHQTSDKAIIDWRSFNIAPHETTQFIQPNSSSIVLNRVDPAQGMSSILGTLVANGQVWILNPAGVFFGNGARVDVGGLLATTASITNSNFMNGNYHFIQSPDWDGSVINEGTITVSDRGLVMLVSPTVANHGVIQANLGTVVLAATNEFTVDFYGDQLINFGESPVVTKSGVSAVTNSGKIFANGGKVLLTAHTAESIVDRAINMSGFVEAKTAVQQGGEIILMGGDGNVSVTGTMNASGKEKGQQGGKVKILGKKVNIENNATIDVSGDQGGGEVLIGGDFQGKNSLILNADQTFVGSNAYINADAISLGQGGKVIVWADDTTQFYGNISARGGSDGGNGGFVEVSGKENLAFNGFVDTSAPHGLTGTLLLDPRDATIQAAAGACDGTLPAIGTGSCGGTTTDTTISASAILTNLGSNNVSISANRDIFVNASINDVSGAGKTLTLNANNNLTVASAVSVSVPGGITLAADADSSGAGTLTLNSGSSVSSGNNSLILSAANITIDTSVTPASLSSGIGLTQVTASANRTITLGTGAAGLVLDNNELARITSGDLTFITTGGGDILPTGAILTNIPGTVTFTSGDLITIGASATTSVNQLIANATNTFTVNGTLSGTGTLTLNANTDGAGANDFTMGTGGVIKTTSTAANAISIIANDADSGTGDLLLRSITTGDDGLGGSLGGTLTARTDGGNSATNTTGGNITTPTGALTIGSLFMSTPAAMTLTGTISALGTITLNANTDGTGTNNFNMNNVATSISTTSTSANAVNITVNSSVIGTDGDGVATLRGISVGNGGGITVTTSPLGNTAGGDITMPSGALIAQGGTISLTTSQVTGRNIGTTASKIILGNASSNTGTLTLNATTGSSGVFINSTDTDVSPLSINGINSTGIADITSASTIVDTGAISATTLTTNSVGGTILDFGHSIAALNATNVTSGNIQVVNANDLNLVNISQSGGGNFTADVTGVLAINGPLNVGAGNVTLTSTGVMSDATAGAITATLLTATTKNDSPANIILDSLLHNVSSINLSTKNSAGSANVAGAITYRDSTGFDIVNIGTLDAITLTAGGAITQSNPISGATLTVATRIAGGANITLDNSNNEFTTIDLQTLTTGGANAPGIIHYRDATGFDISRIGTTGDVELTAGGAITDSGTLTATGITTLAAGANNITLDTATNNFGTVIIASGNNVTLVDAGAINLGGTTSSIGTLTVTGTSITDSGSMTGTTLIAKTLNNAGGVITLDATHHFSTIDLRALNALGTAPDTGAIVYVDSNGFDVEKVETASTVTLTGGGALTQSGSMRGTTLTATTHNAGGGVNSAITFNDPSNEFTTVSLRALDSGSADVNGAIQYRDATGVALGATQTLGNATILANGIITDSATLVIGGTLTLVSVGGMTLNNANQVSGFNAINSGGGNLSLSANAVPLTITGISQSGGGTVTISNTGTVTIDSGATVGSSGSAIAITATDLDLLSGSTINAGSGNLTITQNTLNGSIGLGATSGTMTISGVELQQMTAANLTLVAPTASVHTSLGNIIVDGVTAANSAAISGTITLTSTAGNFGSIVFQGGSSSFRALTANADDGITVGTGITTTVGNLALDADSGGGTGASDTLTLSSHLTSAGTMTLSAGTPGIVLGGATSLTMQGNLVINNTVNGANNLTIDTGPSGDVTFNEAVGNLNRLGAVTITQMHDWTNVSTFNAASYTQLAGNLTTFENSLNLTGNASITGTQVNGPLNVAGLTLDVNFANLTGVVGGSSGQAAINKITLLNTITAGTHFFDGIDMTSRNNIPIVAVVNPQFSWPNLPVLSMSEDMGRFLPGVSWTESSFGKIDDEDNCVSVGSFVEVCNH